MTFWSILFIVIGILIIAFMILGSTGNDNDEFTGCGCGCGCWFILVGIIMLFAFVIGAGSIVILK